MKFKVSPLMILYAVYLVFTRQIYMGICYFVALLLHELAHANEAHKRGYKLNYIKINVFGTSLNGEFDVMTASDEIAIAIAGPLTNVILAVFFCALWWFFPSTYFFSMDFVLANVAIIAFNLLPIYPLDGGRILLALFSKKSTRSKAYKKVRLIALVVGMLFIALFVVVWIIGFNPSLLFAGVFIIVSALLPEKRCSYERLYQLCYRAKKLEKGLPIKEIAISENSTVLHAQRLLNSEYYTNFVLIDQDLNPTVILSETDVIGRAQSLTEPLKNIITKSK